MRKPVPTLLSVNCTPPSKTASWIEMVSNPLPSPRHQCARPAGGLMQLCAGTRHREIQRLLVIAKKSRAVLMRRGPDTSRSGCPVQIGEQFSPALNQVNCGKMPRRYLSPNDSMLKRARPHPALRGRSRFGAGREREAFCSRRAQSGGFLACKPDGACHRRAARDVTANGRRATRR